MKKMQVIVGLSGGVDSAVSAALLQKAGVKVVGAFIKTWQPDWVECTWKEERRDAMRVAAHLGIPFVTIDLVEEYKKGVADYMIAEYKAGRTPNPDVMCNKEIKFGAFLRKALEMGADAIATGHYSRSQMVNGKWQMLRGVDENKDQSYFLWTLNQEQLSKVIFPIGHLFKSEVRELARELKLPVADKRDSQGICFLGQVDMKDFLSHYIESKPGEVLDESGKVIGHHNGATFYTLGERLGGDMVYERTPKNKPLYVVGKSVENNTLTVSSKSEQGIANQESHVVRLTDVNWVSSEPTSADKISVTKRLTAQLRYHGEKLACVISGDDVTFGKPVQAVPGQSLVIYEGEKCLCGGVIY